MRMKETINLVKTGPGVKPSHDNHATADLATEVISDRGGNLKYAFRCGGEDGG